MKTLWMVTGKENAPMLKSQRDCRIFSRQRIIRRQKTHERKLRQKRY
jgi:hypothetical protein